ncbi:MAG TPA: hypothetical protein VIJ86_10355 [Acidimicrobiales bacterium]
MSPAAFCPRIARRSVAEYLSVHDGADLGLPGGTRITVGWPPQMATLRDVLRRYVGSITREPQ